METKNEIHMYVLTQEQINQIAAIAGKEAVQTFRTEQAKVEKRRAREENKVKKTKKMLSSYRRIKAMLSSEERFTKEEQIELRWKFIQDLMGNARETVSESERIIQNGEKRRQEDLYYVYRIEKAIELYHEECEKSGNEEATRRYRVLCMMYLADKQYTIQEISQIEKVSDKTIYKDLGIACGIVSAYLLGI